MVQIVNDDEIPNNRVSIKRVEMGEIIKVKNPHDTYTLEEAIEEAKIGKCQAILTFLTGLSILGSGIENTNISYILPYAKCDLELTNGEQGLLSAISYFGIVFTSHLWGFLADTWGRKNVLRVAAIGGFTFSFLSAFSINTISMILLRFLAGAFVAGASSAGYSYISEFHTSTTAARSAAFVSIALSCVWVLMSPLAILLIPMDWSFFIYTLEFKPWRLFMLCTSTVNLWNSILFSILPESPKFLLAMNRKEEALNVLSRIYSINTGLPKEKYPVKSIENVTLGNSLSNAKGVWGFFNLVIKQTKPVFQQPLLTNTWKLCFIVFVMFSIGHGTFMWFPDFLIQLQSYNGAPKTLCEIVGPKTAANSTDQMCNIDNKNLLPFQLLFVVGICFLVLAAMASFYLKKIAPKKLVCSWLIVSMITCILLNVFTEFYAIVMNFVIFLSCCICASIVMAIAVNLYPTNYRAMATAFIMMCGRIGGVSGSSIVGLLLDNNCTLIFYLFGGILINENLGKTLSDGTKKFTLDEAIQITGNGRFHRWIIVLSGIVLMGATIENISIAFVLPYANCDLKMTTTEQGLISSIAFLGIVISSHSWGFLADTWGRKKVIRLTAACALASAFLSAFSINPVLLIFLRFFVGISISGLQASVFSYVSEFHTEEKAPRAASFVSMFMPMIFIYSSIVGFLLIPMNWSFDLFFVKFVPWRLYMIVISFVNAINTLTFSFLPESPKFLLAMNEPDEALNVLRTMYTINTGYLKESYPVHHLVQEASTNSLIATKGFSNILKLVWNQTKPIFVAPYLDSTAKLCFMVFTLFAVGHGTLMWLSDFLIQLLNNEGRGKTLCEVVGHARIILTSDQECTIDNTNTITFQIMFYIGIVFTISSAMISFYLDKISPRVLVPVWIIISSLCSVALNFLTEFYSIVIAFVTFQSSCICAAIISAISVSLYPTNIRAMATCFIFMFGRIGGLAGGNLIGILIENSCNLIFNVFAGLSLICAFVFLLIKRETPKPVAGNHTNECCT